MEDFFGSIERQAYRMALVACANRDDALEVVQDSMCQFVAKYADKPRDEMKPLFYRVLQNKIRDFRRREMVRSRWRIWFSGEQEEDRSDPLENLSVSGSDPEQDVRRREAFERLQQELLQLSLKQQQIFLLRAWEELSVAETALAMGCSEGTVKSHYFRATRSLQEKLGEDWP